jgi:hypothetical protein
MNPSKLQSKGGLRAMTECRRKGVIAGGASKTEPGPDGPVIPANSSGADAISSAKAAIKRALNAAGKRLVGLVQWGGEVKMDLSATVCIPRWGKISRSIHHLVHARIAVFVPTRADFLLYIDP